MTTYCVGTAREFAPNVKLADVVAEMRKAVETALPDHAVPKALIQTGRAPIRAGGLRLTVRPKGGLISVCAEVDTLALEDTDQ